MFAGKKTKKGTRVLDNTNTKKEKRHFVRKKKDQRGRKKICTPSSPELEGSLVGERDHQKL